LGLRDKMCIMYISKGRNFYEPSGKWKPYIPGELKENREVIVKFKVKFLLKRLEARIYSSVESKAHR